MTSLRAAISNDEEATDAALVEFSHELAAVDPDERPFAAPEYWAGFAYTGV